MASGFFPLDKHDDDFAELTAMADRLGEIILEKYGSVAEYCTPENAADDGSYLGRLSLAAQFIRHCLQGNREDEAAVLKHHLVELRGTIDEYCETPCRSLRERMRAASHAAQKATT